MIGKRLGAIALTGLLATGAPGQEARTFVDPDGRAITVVGDQLVHSTPRSSVGGVDRPLGTGGVGAIPEFIGERQEGFEAHCPCDPSVFECIPAPRMFQDIADLCGDLVGITFRWSFTCVIEPHSGSWFFGGLRTSATITFDDGWEARRFGGYFGTNAGDGDDADIEFNDINDNLIDVAVADIPADCSWNWNGWESPVPIKRIVITGNNRYGGGHVMLDEMEWSQASSDRGACCLPDGSCTDDVPSIECRIAGGQHTADTLCVDIDPACAEQAGRCCLEAGGGGCTRDPEWVCDGDTDGDGQVNPVDSGLVQAAFGSTDEADLCQYDVDCDGQINPVDSGIVQSLFGTCDAPRDSCGGGGDPACEVITPSECRARGGDFAGFGSDCEDDPCGFATGACCSFPECLGTTRKAACDDLGGRWYVDQTCPEFACPDVVACGWDNGMIPDGFNGRAISPPLFPDIRVVDDIFADGAGCTVLNFHANVVEDEEWTEDGMITVFVYEDTGSGPGALIDSVETAYTRVAAGDDYFGRDDFDYFVEDVLLDLPSGVSWIGIRNAGGGGSGTNFWMTSDGGLDGPGSDTGWFSDDGGNSFQAEGAGWHHAFEITP